MEWMKDLVEPALQAEFERFVRTGDASPAFLEKLATDERLQDAADRAFAEGVRSLAAAAAMADTRAAAMPSDRVAEAADELAALSPPEQERELARFQQLTERRPALRSVIARLAGVRC